jgi:hypothetical protein
MNKEGLSKRDLLDWVNYMLKTSYEKIDHFGDCVVYIELLSLYFPQKIDLSQIKCIPLHPKKINI